MKAVEAILLYAMEMLYHLKIVQSQIFVAFQTLDDYISDSGMYVADLHDNANIYTKSEVSNVWESNHD